MITRLFFTLFRVSGVLPGGPFTVGIAAATVKTFTALSALDDHFPFLAIRTIHPNLLDVRAGVLAIRKAGAGVETAVTSELNHQRVAGIRTLLVGFSDRGH